MEGRQGTSWVDQWARVQRWRERVRQSRDDGRTDNLGTEGYRDEVFALFQAIWHLKDWIKNDDDVPPVTRDAVESWVKTSDARLLLVAADVCNGSKHKTLTGERADGSGQTRNDVHINVGVWVKCTFYVMDARDDTDWEALELADACMEEWKKYLAIHGLIPPT